MLYRISIDKSQKPEQTNIVKFNDAYLQFICGVLNIHYRDIEIIIVCSILRFMLAQHQLFSRICDYFKYSLNSMLFCFIHKIKCEFTLAFTNHHAILIFYLLFCFRLYRVRQYDYINCKISGVYFMYSIIKNNY